jgi:hypothetical protein
VSIVAIEAGFCETQVLMTDHCGLNEIIEVTPGVIAPDSDESLADGLRMALSDLVMLASLRIARQLILRDRFRSSDFLRYLQSHMLGKSPCES